MGPATIRHIHYKGPTFAVGTRELSPSFLLARLDSATYSFTEEVIYAPRGRAAVYSYCDVTCTADEDTAIEGDLGMVVEIRHACSHLPVQSNCVDDILYAVDERSGQVVLEIGTDRRGRLFYARWNRFGWMPAWLSPSGSGFWEPSPVMKPGRPG